MDTLSYKTLSRRKEDVDHGWYVVDAENQVLGRMCARIAAVLRGKHKPDYTPHVDTGDHVIVLHAGKVRLTGAKLDQREYIRYSGYPGGQKRRTVRQQLDKRPEGVVENAVRGMLPKNKLGRAMFRKLHVFIGDQHPHQAQKPESLKV